MGKVTVFSDTLNNVHLGETKGDLSFPSLIQTHGCAWHVYIHEWWWWFSVKAIKGEKSMKLINLMMNTTEMSVTNWLSYKKKCLIIFLICNDRDVCYTHTHTPILHNSFYEFYIFLCSLVLWFLWCRTSKPIVLMPQLMYRCN